MSSLSRSTVLLVALSGLMGSALAQKPPTPQEPFKPKPLIAVGAKAPPIQGEAWAGSQKFKGFEKDKVYIVYFWNSSAWGRTVTMILNEYKLDFKDVTIVAITNDAKKGQRAYADFMRSSTLPYSHTFVDDKESATMKKYIVGEMDDLATYQFVIGKDGKIAYVSPNIESLPIALKKMVGGKWDGAKDAERMKERDAAWDKYIATHSKNLREAYEKGAKVEVAKRQELITPVAKEALVDLNAYLKENPERETVESIKVHKLRFCILAGDKDGATAVLDILLKDAEVRKDIRILIMVTEWMAQRFAQGYGTDGSIYSPLVEKIRKGVAAMKFGDSKTLRQVEDLALAMITVNCRAFGYGLLKDFTKDYTSDARPVIDEMMKNFAAAEGEWIRAQEAKKKATKKDK